jgi:hypothetical protein
VQAYQSATIHGQPLVKCSYMHICMYVHMYVCMYTCVWAKCPNVTDKHTSNCGQISHSLQLIGRLLNKLSCYNSLNITQPTYAPIVYHLF